MKINRVNRWVRRGCAFLFGLMLVTSVKAQSVTVDAKIDSAQILIGEQAKIKLEVSLDAKSKLQLPLFPDTLIRGIDVVETLKPDTQYLNDKKRLLISQEYIVTSFDSALYFIPPMEVLVDKKPYRSQSLALKVLSVPVDTTHTDQFFGPKSVMDPAFMWEDWYGVIISTVLVLIFIGAIVYLIKRFKDNKPIIRTIKVEPKLPPHMKAMKDIEQIKQEKHGEDPKSYYTALTDVLRTYMKERFGFNALEMTSSEIIERLMQEKDQVSMSELKTLFQTADLVKFAKLNPLINENDMNLVNAIDFINQTKVEVQEKPVETEITVEEKRSKRAKLLLGASIIGLFFASLGLIAYIAWNVYDMCF